MVDLKMIESHLATPGVVDSALFDLLSKQELSLQDLAMLLQPFLIESSFRIEALTGGLSKAGALLIVPPASLPIVIKFAEAQIIEDEERLFNKIVVPFMPARLRPGSIEKSCLDDKKILALRYFWSGDEREVSTLHDILIEGALRPQQIRNFIDELASAMWTYHSPSSRGGGIPHFNFRDKKALIISKLEEFIKEVPAVPRLISLVRGQERWPKVRLKRCNSANIHGDFHSKNILAVLHKNRLAPRVVDFHDVQQKESVARDWARLERDIKFRCLFQCAAGQHNRFVVLLDRLNQSLRASRIPSAFRDQPEELCASAVLAIRETYQENSCKISDVPKSEYLHYLVCFELETLCWDYFDQGDPAQQKEIVRLIASTFIELEQTVQQEAGLTERILAAPHRLREWQKFDWVLLCLGIIGVAACILFFDAAFPYRPFRSDVSSDSVIEKTKYYASLFYPNARPVDFTAEYNPPFDATVSEAIQYFGKQKALELLQYDASWSVSAGSYVDAEYDRFGRLREINFPSIETRLKIEQEIPAEQSTLVQRAAQYAQQLFRSDVGAIRPTEFQIERNNYVNSSGSFPASKGAPFEWVLYPETPQERHIHVNISASGTLVSAEDNPHEYQQNIIREMKNTFWHSLAEEKRTAFQEATGELPAITIEIDNGEKRRPTQLIENVFWIMGLGFLVISLILLRRQIFSADRIVRSVLTALGIVVVLPDVVLSSPSFEMIKYAEEHGVSKFAIMCGAIPVLLFFNFLLVSVIWNYCQKLFPDQIASIVELRHRFLTARSTGAALVRGAFIGVTICAIFIGWAICVTHFRLGALTDFQFLDGKPFEALVLGISEPLSATFSIILATLLSATVVRLLTARKWVVILLPIAILTFIGVFDRDSFDWFSNVAFYCWSAIFSAVFIGLLYKFDILTLFTALVIFFVGVHSLPVFIVFGESGSSMLTLFILPTILLLAGILLWFQPYWAAVSDRLQASVRGAAQ